MKAATLQALSARYTVQQANKYVAVHYGDVSCQ
jgi:hypothetical protein